MILAPQDLSLLDTQQPVNWGHYLNGGLVSWWKVLPQWFGGSTWRDLCNRNHGTLTNMDPATDWVRGGHRGGSGALDFDGTNDYVSAPALDAPFLGALTISVWSRIDTGSNFRHFAGKHLSGGGTKNPFDYRTSNAAIPSLDFVRSNDTDAVGWRGPSVVLGEWKNYTVTHPGDIGIAPTFYVNGIPTVGTNIFGSGTGNPTGSGADIVMGRRDDGAVLLDGQLDDVRIYSRALSDSAVFNLYVESQKPAPATLNYHNPAWMWAQAAAAGGGMLLRHPGMTGHMQELAGGMRA